MVELRSYFLSTIHKHDYYNYKFGKLINQYTLFEYDILDDDDAIEKFKELILPYNKTNPIKDVKDDELFIYLCNYLNDRGYYIEQYPIFLERPTDRWDLSYDKIRNSIIEECGYNGAVAWADRRIFVSKLKFLKRNLNNITDEMHDIFKSVSTRNESFNNMSYDEKLEAICNSIEYILKPNKKSDKYMVLDYTDSDGYLSDDIVKTFRNKLEIFRHSTRDDIEKRNEMSDDQKDFLVSYGLLIIDFISKRQK